MLSGKEASYVRAALGISATAHQGKSTTPSSSEDERVALLSHEMGRMGIHFNVWTRWTLDQMAVFREGQRLHVQDVDEQVGLLNARAKSMNVTSPLRFTVGLD